MAPHLEVKYEQTREFVTACGWGPRATKFELRRRLHVEVTHHSREDVPASSTGASLRTDETLGLVLAQIRGRLLEEKRGELHRFYAHTSVLPDFGRDPFEPL